MPAWQDEPVPQAAADRRSRGKDRATALSENQNLLAEQRRALILDEVQARRGEGQRADPQAECVRHDDPSGPGRAGPAGVIEKVHGGAVPVVEASTHEPGFEVKSALELSAKEDIARTAAAMAQPGSAIALSGGTTTYALARHLLDVPDLTVVTNSVRVADVFHDAQRPVAGRGARPGTATVVLTGGVRTPSDSLVGPVADRAIDSLHFDLLFLGVHGISAEAGLSTPNRGGGDQSPLRPVGPPGRGGGRPHQVGHGGAEFLRHTGRGGHLRDGRGAGSRGARGDRRASAGPGGGGRGARVARGDRLPG